MNNFENDFWSVKKTSLLVLNNKTSFWAIFENIFKSIFYRKNWNNLKSVFEKNETIIEFLMTIPKKAEKLKWKKVILIFAFEIFYNFCKLFEFCVEIDENFYPNFSTIELISFHNLFVKVKNNVLDNIQLFMRRRYFMKLTSRFMEQNMADFVPFRYKNFFKEKCLSFLTVNKEVFLKEMNQVYDFLHVHEFFIEAKMTEILIKIHDDLVCLDEQIKVTISKALNMKFNQQRLLSGGDVPELEEMGKDNLNKESFRNFKNMECSICRISEIGLHFICGKCDHSVHYSHFNQIKISEEYLCDRCGDCACMKITNNQENRKRSV